MSDKEFRVLLNLFMVSDPWPLTDSEQEQMEEMLNREAVKRGHENWVVAYHEIKV